MRLYYWITETIWHQQNLLGLRLVQGVQILAENRDDALVLIGILSEDVLEDYHSFLDHIRDLILDELHKGADTAFGSCIHLDGTSPNSTDRLSDKVHIYFSCISVTTK